VHEIRDSVITVLGNHDLHLLALHSGAVQRGNRFKSLAKLLRSDHADELCDWLRHQPLAHYDRKLKTLLVHAGTHPQWTARQTVKRAAEVEAALRGDAWTKLLGKMYGDMPNSWSDSLGGYKRLRFIINCLTRMRMLTPSNQLDLRFSGSPWRARKGETPWYDVKAPAWQGTRVVFGHWSALGLLVLPHAVSLDTGCVWGRQLTAVRLDKRLPRVIQVEGQAR
jgi:bis(5'-nucleosyl)-tetraphosphatase (symmetrical)